MTKLLLLAGGQIILALALLSYTSFPLRYTVSNIMINRPAVLGEGDTAVTPTDTPLDQSVTIEPTLEPTLQPTPYPTPDNQQPTLPAAEQNQPQPPITEAATPPPIDSAGNLTEPTVDVSQPSIAVSPTSTAVTPTDSGSAAETPGQTEVNSQPTSAVVNAGEMLNSSEGLNPQVILEVASEEEKLTKTTDPVVQTQELLSFSKDKVSDINNSLKSEDPASANFASQRFNDQITKITENLGTLTGSAGKALRSQAANLCREADDSLRSAQLMVPEEAEQDLEINRASCLNLMQ